MEKKEIEFKLVDVPEWSEVKELYDWLLAQKFLGKITYRDFILFMFLIWYGRRLHEITSLTTDDIKLTEGTYGKIYFTQLKKGKTGQGSVRVKVALPVIRHLREYLKEYIDNYILAIGERELFVLTDRQARNVVYKYSELFYEDIKGVKKRLRPHAFRHAILSYLTHTKGPAYAKYWGGHSNISITNIYLHTNYNDIESGLPEEFK